MKKILQYVPGFRTNKLWKKIIASIYYIMYLIILFDEPSIGLFALTIPFLIFYSIAAFKYYKKNKTYTRVNLGVLTVSLIIGVGSFAIGGESNSASDITNKSKPIPITEPNKKEEKVIKIQDKEVAIIEEDISEEVKTLVYEGKKNLKVHYIDVGQGDSIFIELPNGQNALIDGGPGSNKNHLIKYLKGLDFQTIDYLVATHPHEDHIGGLPEVIRTFEIGKVYMPNATHTTNIYLELLTEIQSKGSSIVKTETGTILLDEPGLRLKALAPDPYTSGSDFNDYSIVLRLDYNNNSFMFTGDGETLTEQYLLADNSDEELKVNVLKIGHHGSDTSTTQPFIDKVNPEHSVITCGKGNSYGHPIPSVISRLENANIAIYRTDTDGTIIATSDGEKITFTKKGNPIEPNAPPTEAKKEIKEEVKQKDNAETKPATPAANKATDNSSGGSNTGSATQVGQGEVFITPTGKKYHRQACGKGNYSATTLEDAKSRGLEPCKKCY